MAQAVPIRGVESQDDGLSEGVFADVLRSAVDVIDKAGVDYLLVGGVGSASLGRPRWTHDIDFLVAPAQADAALEALAGGGFATERTNEHWIFKAAKDRVVVDVIFRMMGDVYLDDEMLAHGQDAEFLGVRARVAAPEDQIVIKAIAHDEQSARHWNDALALIASCEIDWEYLLERARRGARRVLSLLVYAQANDLVVPNSAIQKLFHGIYNEE